MILKTKKIYLKIKTFLFPFSFFTLSKQTRPLKDSNFWYPTTWIIRSFRKNRPTYIFPGKLRCFLERVIKLVPLAGFSNIRMVSQNRVLTVFVARKREKMWKDRGSVTSTCHIQSNISTWQNLWRWCYSG